MSQTDSLRFPVVGRLAPSPTGGLHLGHARTFFIAWLAARANQGKLILRIEDLDATRARPEAIAGALVDLRWLGFNWDEGPDVGGPSAPYIQSERFANYEAALEQLKQAELVYPCTCTRADIARAASAPHPEDEGPIYPGTCAIRTAADALALGDRPFAWRFRVPHEPVRWSDAFLGETALDPSRSGGDFIVARSPRTFAYQLAVVCDDAQMGVNQVLRGDDLVASTPRQILLYRALGFDQPQFGHLPLVLGADGQRLAKRDGSIKLSTLREGGLDPHRLNGWLAQSCGFSDTLEPSAAAHWIPDFELGQIPRQPWTVTPSAWETLMGDKDIS